MATMPATAPVAAPRVVATCSLKASNTSHINNPAAAANWVFTNALTATLLAPNADPALNPNQPNQRMPAPNRVRGTEGGCIDALGHPRRRPSTNTTARVENPELISTTVPPAKSSTPRWASHPPGLKAQWARGTYTSVNHSAMKTTKPTNRTRSTVPPLMRAAVTTANII